MAKLKTHPYADLFPMMPDAQMDSLVASIKDIEQQLPIILDQHDLVIDGRNRLLACERAGVDPITEVRHFQDDAAVLRFIMAINHYRRHLTDSQRALIAEKAANLSHGQNKPQMSESPIGRLLPFVSLEEAAEAMGVSERSTTRARKVKKTGIPEILEMVEAGTVSLRKAEEIATLPEEKQREVAACGPKEVNKVAGEMRREARATTVKEETSPANGKEEVPQENGKYKRRPVGIDRANEAINCLTRIPKNDALRKRGLQRVTDWIRRNK